MNARRRLFAVTCDIPSDARRGRVATILKSFGGWVQCPAFECYPTRGGLTNLRQKLVATLDQEEDSVRLNTLEPPVSVLGPGEPTEDTDVLLV